MVKVHRIRIVEDHPTIPNLSNITLMNGTRTISSYTDEGKPRYIPGQYVVFIPDGWIVPEYLLRQGYWNEEKNKGALAGSKGNRVKARITDTIHSEGIMFPVEFEPFDDFNQIAKVGGRFIAEQNYFWSDKLEDADVSDKLEIVKWEQK